MWRENGGGIYTGAEELYTRVNFLGATVANIDVDRVYAVSVNDGERFEGLSGGALGARAMGS